MKKIFAIFCIAATALLSSCVRKGDLDLAPVPDIAFEYTCDGLTLTFNSVVPNTTDVKWEILKTKNGSAETLTTGAGDTFTYTFPTPDNYWIKMSGVYEGEEQVVAGKILVAKPSPVKLDDDSFADWDAVTYPDFQMTGTDGISYAKFDYNADYVFFFVALNVTETPGCTARAFCEPVITAPAPSASMSSSSARKALIASTIRILLFIGSIETM